MRQNARVNSPPPPGFAMRCSSSSAHRQVASRRDLARGSPDGVGPGEIVLAGPGNASDLHFRKKLLQAYQLCRISRGFWETRQSSL